MNKFFIIILFSFTLLCGCSSKFAYNNLDWLVHWYMDDYIDLDKQQKQVFNKNLDVWLTWHRADELLKYKTHLQHIQEQLQEGAISTEQWLTHFDTASQHWYRVRDKIAVDLGTLVERLSERQIDALFDKLEMKNLKRWEEHTELTVAERETEKIENLQDLASDWIGRLSVRQKTIIATSAIELESNFEEWIAYRRDIQKQAKFLFLHRHENSDFKTQFLALINHPEVYQSQTFIARSERNKRIYADLLAQISEGLSSKQMKTLKREIQALIEDIDDLVND